MILTRQGLRRQSLRLRSAPPSGLEAWRRVVVSCLLLFAKTVEEGARALGMSTEDLIRRFQQGQPRAFEALYDRFKDTVYRTALYLTRNSGDAEEAVQETFMDVLRALPNYRIDGPARFETWLYRVTYNRCRARRRRKTLPSADWDGIEDTLEQVPDSRPHYDPEVQTLRRERAVNLWQAVDQLGEEHRAVVLLRYQHELSYQEIAQVLGISIGTVKSRLYNAHRKLNARLQATESGLLRTEAGVA